MDNMIKVFETIGVFLLFSFATFMGFAIVMIFFDLIFQVFTDGTSIIREVIAPFLNKILKIR